MFEFRCTNFSGVIGEKGRCQIAQVWAATATVGNQIICSACHPTDQNNHSLHYPNGIVAPRARFVLTESVELCRCPVVSDNAPKNRGLVTLSEVLSATPDGLTQFMFALNLLLAAGKETEPDLAQEMQVLYSTNWILAVMSNFMNPLFARFLREKYAVGDLMHETNQMLAKFPQLKNYLTLEAILRGMGLEI